MSWICVTNSKFCRKLNLSCFFLTPFPFFKDDEPQVTDYPVLLTFLNQTIGIFVITLFVMLLFSVPLFDTFGTYGLFVFSPELCKEAPSFMAGRNCSIFSSKYLAMSNLSVTKIAEKAAKYLAYRMNQPYFFILSFYSAVNQNSSRNIW